MTYSCYFSFGKNQDFPPPKKFFNIDFRRYETCLSQSLSSLVINLQIEFMSYLEGEFC